MIKSLYIDIISIMAFIILILAISSFGFNVCIVFVPTFIAFAAVFSIYSYWLDSKLTTLPSLEVS